MTLLEKTSEMETMREAAALMKTIGVPPQPMTLLELNKLARDPNASLEAMSELVARDMSLSARVVKLASSPLFGGIKEIKSIKEALMSLGMKTLIRNVLTCALEEAFEKNSWLVSEQWTHSKEVACVCQITAEEFAPELSDQAYTLGLFHDLAIPMMMRKFGDYKDQLDRAMYWDDMVADEEDAYYCTNHGSAGYIIAKKWALPVYVLESILFHHNPEMDIHADSETRSLKAILQLSEICHTHFRKVMPRLSTEDYEDIAHLQSIAGVLNFDLEEDLDPYLDRVEEALSAMAQGAII